VRLPALSAGILLLVAGCAVGPAYRAPKSDVPAQWNVPLSGGERGRPADTSQWWRSFADAELDALVRKAVQSNFTVRVAESRVREARAERAVVAGGLWPSVGSSAGYSRNSGSSPGRVARGRKRSGRLCEGKDAPQAARCTRRRTRSREAIKPSRWISSSCTRHWEGDGALSTISPLAAARVCKSSPPGAVLSGQPAPSSAEDTRP
jgi:Outer membrane efflux protein